MNKSQLIDTLATGFEGNRKSAAQALDTILETITRTVVTGEKVGITGFGVFEKLDKPARTVRNPATGASVRKKKTSVPRFRAGAELKAYVSGEKKFPRGSAAKTSATTAASRTSPAKTSAAKTSPARSSAAKSSPATSSPAKSSPAKSSAAKSSPAKTGRAKSSAAKSSAATSTRKSSAAAKKSTRRTASKS